MASMLSPVEKVKIEKERLRFEPWGTLVLGSQEAEEELPLDAEKEEPVTQEEN